jgi:hypothetical protein
MALTSKLVKSVACLDFGEECARGGLLLLLLLWVGPVLFLFSSVPFPSCERGLWAAGREGDRAKARYTHHVFTQLCYATDY